MAIWDNVEEWAANPMTMMLLSAAAGAASAPRGLGSTLGGTFGGLANGMQAGAKMQQARTQAEYQKLHTEQLRQQIAQAARLVPLQEQALSGAFQPPPWMGGGAPMGVPAVVPDAGGATDPERAAPRPATPLGTASDRARQAYDYAIGRGMSPAAASAIVANIKHESNFDENVSHDGGIGVGILGWNGPRRAALESKYGPNPTYQQQLEFLHDELDGKFPGAMGAGEAMRRPGVTPGDAAADYSSIGVRPRDVETNRRVRAATAEQYYKQFTSPQDGTQQVGNLSFAAPAQPAALGGNDQFLSALQSPAAAAQPAATPAASQWGPVERANWYMQQAARMAFVKPELATQYREQAKMELSRNSRQQTTINGRTAERDLVTQGVTYQDEPRERVTGPGGIETITPASRAVGQRSYPQAPTGYRQVTDAAGNIVDQVPFANGPAGFDVQKIYNPQTRQEEFYRVPRLPVAPGQPAAATAPQPALGASAPSSVASAPVNLTPPGVERPSWMAGSVLQPATPAAPNLPPGAVSLGASGPPNGNPAGLEPKVKAEVETQLLESQNAMAGINRTRELFRPEFLQTSTRLGNWWSATRERTPELLGKLDEPARKDLTDFTRWRSSAYQDLNQIIKDQSGAAVTDQELQRMMVARPNPGTGVFNGDSPTEFKAKMDEVLELKQRAVLRNAWALRRGVSPLDSGVSLDQVPKMMTGLLDDAAQAIQAANPNMKRDQIKAEAMRQVGQALGVGALR